MAHIWSLHVSSVEAREIWCAYNYMSAKARDPRVNWNDHIVHRGVHYGVCAGAQDRNLGPQRKARREVLTGGIAPHRHRSH